MNTLDLQAAAAFLHIHPVTLQEKARAGEIPGAKIGKCWVFVDVDLVEHIRAQYPRRVLQSERKELEPCHSTGAPIHRVGGSRSATAEQQYSAGSILLKNSIAVAAFSDVEKVDPLDRAQSDANESGDGLRPPKLLHEKRETSFSTE